MLQMQLSLTLVPPLALVSTHRNHPLIARMPTLNVIFSSNTRPHVDPYRPMELLNLAPTAAIADFHQHVDIAPQATQSTRGAQLVKNVPMVKSQMRTAPRVLTQSHALPAWTAAVVAPQMTLTNPMGAPAVVAVAGQDLLAARHLHVTQLLIAVVMAPRLMWIEPMAVNALAMRGLRDQTVQHPQYPQLPERFWGPLCLRASRPRGMRASRPIRAETAHGRI